MERKKVLTPQFSVIITVEYKPIDSPQQTLQMYQELNTNLPSACFDCRLIPQIHRESSHITFQRVEEELPAWAEDGRAVVAVVFGVVFCGGVAA